jgi:hypothetical protein
MYSCHLLGLKELEKRIVYSILIKNNLQLNFCVRFSISEGPSKQTGARGGQRTTVFIDLGFFLRCPLHHSRMIRQ